LLKCTASWGKFSQANHCRRSWNAAHTDTSSIPEPHGWHCVVEGGPGTEDDTDSEFCRGILVINSFKVKIRWLTFWSILAYIIYVGISPFIIIATERCC
jgi:predicted nucleic acid-binding Zn ribbon protein